MPILKVTTLDLAILITYVLGSRVIFGWYIARKRRQRDSEAYFLGGRNIHWAFIGLSFYVSNMSDSTFVGLPGSGYLNGIAVYHYEWLPVVILMVFITFILPFYLESRVFTAPQFLEKRFNAHAKLIFSCFLLLPNLFILILPGVMAQMLYHDLDTPDLVFPLLAFDLLPIGLRGLMLAALAAAILSSLESIFNSAATLFTMDFVAHFRPRLPEATLVRTGQAATIGFMVLSALWAPRIAHFPSLWQYLQSILAYITPPVVVLFMLGIFWRRATAAAAVVTLSVGIPAGVLGWILIEIAAVYRIQFLYACGLMTLFSTLLFVGVSLVTAPPATGRTTPLTWSRAYWRRESAQLKQQPWYLNYRWQSAVLLAIALMIVATWW